MTILAYTQAHSRKTLAVRADDPRMDAPKRGETDGELMIAEPETRVKRPPMYQVILLNDDYTPMDFVVSVLEQIFRKAQQDAMELMLAVHEKGAATVAIYTRDVAETKVDEVINYARINEYPLQCIMEQA